jgi:hypothetical protein
MQHDQARPEDMDSNLEDAAADEWRYACMSRPWIKTVKEKRPERVKDAYERAGGDEIATGRRERSDAQLYAIDARRQ